MRVVITVSDPSYDKGGVAAFYERLRPYLPADAEYLYVGKRGGEGGGGAARLAAATRLLSDWARLWRALGRDNVQALHVNPSLDPRSLLRDGVAALLARARGKRLIVFVRGWQDSTAAALDRSPSLFRLVFGRADAFIVLAAEFRRAVRRWGYAGPVYVHTTAVAGDVLGAVDEDWIRARCRRPGPCTTLFLARVRADKGVFEALQAVRDAQRAQAPVHLVVAGDGPDLPAATRWVNDHGPLDVRFVGDVRGEVKREVLRDADVYLFPTSHGEGMPASVLEAMAYGMTVIACPVGGLKDFFADGEHGLLCQAPDPGPLAELLSRVAADAALRERLGVAAHRFALAHFTAQQAAARLAAVYEDVVSRQPGRQPPDADWFAGAEERMAEEVRA